MTYIEPGTLEARQVLDLLADMLKLAADAQRRAKADPTRSAYWQGVAFGLEQAAANLAEASSAEVVHSDDSEVEAR